MINMSAKLNDIAVRRKLLLAEPHILAKNALMATTMLNEVKAAVVAATPEGPGHFGYHGRDTVHVTISVKGVTTTAKLMAAMQIYWREYGTGVRFRGKSSKSAKRVTRIMTGAATGGEPALMIANKALNATKRYIAFYYNGLANWWSA
jgi:hypothetical protein